MHEELLLLLLLLLLFLRMLKMSEIFPFSLATEVRLGGSHGW